MAVSKVHRVEGVPQFSDTATCLEFVATCNTQAAALKEQAHSFSFKAKNAAKQLPALARGVTTDDLNLAKADVED